jgi:hypothetical protein
VSIAAALVSDAVDGALIAAAIAAIGYVAKEIVASSREWRREKAERRVRLHQLEALLNASQGAFRAQKALRNRLAASLTSRFRDELPPQRGYERLFTHFYQRLEPDEKDLHSIIRAYTEHVVQPLNAAMRAWLDDDVEYRLSRGKKGSEATLCKQLNALDAHLLLWLAKYEAWIPGHPDHALVYLADEEEHGEAFPTGIEVTLSKVLEPRHESST